METPKQKLRRWAGQFDADMQVKALVANCYLRDGDDLLELARMGFESDRDSRSFRSKLFVNLRMAIECYLKSLVVACSDKMESPEAAYREARKPKHSLTLLRKAAVNRNGQGLFSAQTDRLIDGIDKMKVDLRYEVDMVSEFWKETRMQQARGTGSMSGTIESSNWFRNLLEHAQFIAEQANTAVEQRLRDHSKCLGSNLAKRAVRIKQFFSQVKLWPAGQESAK